MNVAHLGQVFTPPEIVSAMLELRRNPNGRCLEPSAGAGAFSSRIPGCVAVEIDAAVAAPGMLNLDFFDYPLTEKYDVVIGNPPYVRFADIPDATKKKLSMDMFDQRSNLFLFFIEKACRHLNKGGELIFIVPRELVGLTSASRLNDFLFNEGTITDFIETGDSRIFSGAVPNCCIFRFEKGATNRVMSDGRIFGVESGRLVFRRSSGSVPLSFLFDVKVGAVSGADDIFEHPDGNADFVCSKTIDTGATRRMIYDIQHPFLLVHKERLIQRRIRPFTESNWWRWGRDFHHSPLPRIYVNAKTRREQPFFIHPCEKYDGSVLALFPRRDTIDLGLATSMLNTKVDWLEQGFVCDGRFLFSQRSLQHCLLPDDFTVFK